MKTVEKFAKEIFKDLSDKYGAKYFKFEYSKFEDTYSVIVLSKDIYNSKSFEDFVWGVSFEMLKNRIFNLSIVLGNSGDLK